MDVIKLNSIKINLLYPSPINLCYMINLFEKFVTKHGGQPPVLYRSKNQIKLLVNIVQYCKRKPI